MSFSSAIISFINSFCGSNLDFLCLVGVAATSGVVSVATSGVGLHVGILSKFFIGKNMLLKILREFPLALKSNPKLSKKDFFQLFLYFLSTFFNSVAKLLCLLTESSNDKYSSCLKKTIDNKSLPKL